LIDRGETKMNFHFRSVLLAVLAAAGLDAQQTPPRVLVPGAPLEATLSPGRPDAYSITLEEREFVRVRFLERDAELHWKLFDPAGKILCEPELQHMVWIAETRGTYRLEVDGEKDRTVGIRYGIWLLEQRPATAVDEKRIEAQRLAEAAFRGFQGSSESRREAITNLEQAASLWGQSHDSDLQALALASTGYLHERLGEFTQAIVTHDRAISLAHSAGAPLAQATALNSKAVALQRLARYEEALECFQQAQSQYRSAGSRYGETMVEGNMAILYFSWGEYEQAVRAAEKTLAFRRQTGSLAGQIATLTNLSAAYVGLKDFKKARSHIEQALALAHTAGRINDEALALHALGVIERRMGENQKSLLFLEQALALWNKIGNTAWMVLTLGNIGVTLGDLGDLPKARETLSDTVLQLQSLGLTTLEPAPRYELARVERRMGDLESALRETDMALELHEASRRRLPDASQRADFFATGRETYQFAIELLMEMHRQHPAEGYEAAALAMSERARARSLLDLLAEAGVDLEKDVDPELLKRESSLRNALKAAAAERYRLRSSPGDANRAAEIDRVTQELRVVRAQIRSASPNLASLTPAQPLTAAQIQSNVLDGDTTLLEYALGPERSFLWVLTKFSLSVFDLPKEEEIESAARRAYAELTAQPPVLSGPAIRALGSMLLAPAASQLTSRRLVVVADGALRYIPFAALRSVNGAMLIDKYAVLSAPSASTLAVLRQRRVGRVPASRVAAVLADPVYDPKDLRVSDTPKNAPTPVLTKLDRSAHELGLVRFDRLYASRGEAEAIRELAPKSDVLEALDFQASRDTAMSPGLSQYRILHFATHGLLNSSHPELSGLVLSLVDSRGRPRDGFLQAHEIYNLKLGAELVVLSACQTALGKEIRGEGLVGLTQAFMHAGSPAVLASLWRVADVATAELMKRFYQGLLQQKLSPAEALRAAQLSIRKEARWAAPYYWAGFTLQGEWQ
jgi:CHAT domain-containing protein